MEAELSSGAQTQLAEKKATERCTIALTKHADLKSLPADIVGLEVSCLEPDQPQVLWRQFVEGLCIFARLQDLSVEGCPFGDTLCAKVRELRSLKKLRLANCKLSYRGTSLISQIRSITRLNLDGNPGVTFDQFFELLKKLPHLTEFSCPITTAVKISLTDSMLALREIDLLTRNIERVKYLSLTNDCDFHYQMNHFGDEGLLLISRRMPNLKSLSAANNNLTREGVVQMAKNMPQLRDLTLDKRAVDHWGLLNIGRWMLQLRTLDLTKRRTGWQYFPKHNVRILRRRGLRMRID